MQGTPIPLLRRTHGRFHHRDNWQVCDISVNSSAGILVSFFNRENKNTSIQVYSGIKDEDKRIFEKAWPSRSTRYSWYGYRKSSFWNDYGDILTSQANVLEVLRLSDENNPVPTALKFQGEVCCLTVKRKRIYIGLWDTNTIGIYDLQLKKVDTILIASVEQSDCPLDMAVTGNKVVVCTSKGRALLLRQTDGNILYEYRHPTAENAKASSVAVSEKLNLVSILWNKNKLCLYSFDSNYLVLVVQIEDSMRTRVYEQETLITITDQSEVKTYELVKLFTYENLKITLSNLMRVHDCQKLKQYLGVPSKDPQMWVNYNRMYGNEHEETKDQKLALVLFEDLEQQQMMSQTYTEELMKGTTYLGQDRTTMLRKVIEDFRSFADDTGSTLVDLSQSDKSQSEESSCLQGKQIFPFSEKEQWRIHSICIDQQSSLLGIFGCKDNQDNFSLSIFPTDKLDVHNESPWLMSKDFTENEIFISFMDSRKVVTCCNHTVKVYEVDLFHLGVSASYEIPDQRVASCMSVNNEEVFIGLSKAVLVLNSSLRYMREIKLQGIQDISPRDLTVTNETLFLCTSSRPYKALSFKKSNGEILREFKKFSKGASIPLSITASEENNLVFISWCESSEDENNSVGEISVHSLSNGYSLVVFEQIHAENIRFRGNDQLLTLINGSLIKMFPINQFFSFTSLKKTLSTLLSINESEELHARFNKGDHEKQYNHCLNTSGWRHWKRQRIMTIFSIMEDTGVLRRGTEFVDLTREIAVIERSYVLSLQSPILAYLQIGMPSVLKEERVLTEEVMDCGSLLKAANAPKKRPRDEGYVPTTESGSLYRPYLDQAPSPAKRKKNKDQVSKGQHEKTQDLHVFGEAHQTECMETDTALETTSLSPCTSLQYGKDEDSECSDRLQSLLDSNLSETESVGQLGSPMRQSNFETENLNTSEYIISEGQEYFTSLKKEDKKALLRYAKQNQILKECVRRLNQMFFSFEERMSGNCSGRKVLKQLDETRVSKIICICMWLETVSKQNEPIEQKDICEQINRLNKRLREKMSRQRKAKSQ